MTQEKQKEIKFNNSMETSQDKILREYNFLKTVPELTDIENLILNTAVKTGRFVRENALNIEDLQWKDVDDPVTDLDKKAERLIIDAIKKQGYKSNYYGEEFGIEDNGANMNIYTDPIDGTKSFIRGEYMSSLSVAADKDKELFMGVVNDFMKDLTYYATSKGAYLRSNNKIRKLPNINLDFSKPTISFGWNIDTNEEIAYKINVRRQIGSIALAMAQLASGSYDALVMKPHKKKGVTDTCDIAAGYYIMKQAGIEMTDFHGNEFNYREPGQGIIAYRKSPKLEEVITERKYHFQHWISKK